MDASGISDFRQRSNFAVSQPLPHRPNAGSAWERFALDTRNTDRWAAERAAVVARRLARDAAFAMTNPVDWDQMARQAARADKSRETWRRGQAARRTPRRDLAVPAPTRQFGMTRTSAITDPGLTRTAAQLLARLSAECSAARSWAWTFTKRGLALALTCAPCSVRRALRLLEDRGYIAVDVMLDARARTSGLVITLLPPARPPAAGGGVQERPHLKDKKILYRGIPVWQWRLTCRIAGRRGLPPPSEAA